MSEIKTFKNKKGQIVELNYNNLKTLIVQSINDLDMILWYLNGRDELDNNDTNISSHIELWPEDLLQRIKEIEKQIIPYK